MFLLPRFSGGSSSRRSTRGAPPGPRSLAGLFVGVVVGVVAVTLLGIALIVRPMPRSVSRAPTRLSASPISGGGSSASSTPEPSGNPTTGPAAASAPTPAATAPTSAPTATSETSAITSTGNGVPVSLGSSRFGVVLLGYGGPDHDGAYLTDSIVVVVVDPVAKTLTLLSVPRDSWVPLGFDGETDTYNKVNTAYAFAKDPSLYSDRLTKYSGSAGAGVFAEDTISRITGIPISYYVGLDFEGFRQMIDAVGGIDVDVPDSFTANYPTNDDSSVDASWMTVSFTAGPAHLNGERAIEFARAREVLDNPDEGSDFARSRRQRLIMEAFKDRLVQPAGLIHLPQVLAVAANHVDTNYSLPGYTQLAQLILGWKDVKIYQTALSTTNYLQEATGPDGTYALVPDNSNLSWAPVRAFGRQLWKDPELGVEIGRTQIDVVNASGVDGLATQVSDELSGLGYVVGPPSSAPRQSWSGLVDETGGKSPRLLDALRQELDLPGLDVSTGTPADSPEISLVLGTDATGLLLKVPSDAAAPISFIPTPVPTPVPSIDTNPRVSSPDDATPTPLPLQSAPPSPSARGPRGPTAPAHPPARATEIAVPGRPEMVVVPRLVGLPEAVAQQMIDDSGLMTTYVNYQTIDQVSNRKFFRSVPVGAVLSEYPAAGTQVSRGTRIALAVRKS